jgi:hypothetical protein
VNRRGRRVGLFCVAALLLNACGEPRESFVEGPRGFVEFYIPGDDPLAAELNADASIFLLRDGRRVFQGMTLRWSKLTPVRHGLVVAVAPGNHRFSVEVAGGETPVTVAVEENGYVPVRISSSGPSRTAMLGTTDRVQLRISASVESPRVPGEGN